MRPRDLLEGKTWDLSLSNSPSQQAITCWQIQRPEAFSRWQETDMLEMETQKAVPVSFPFSSGMILPTALVVPVEAGMMFWAAPWPSHHSSPEGGHPWSSGWQRSHGLLGGNDRMDFWVATIAWIMIPSMMLKLS
uniref:Uncharacterized protein n=2 Tax=Canis lupus familiaris TaxID=9615 RepID=A0A8P0SZD2_CANLF